MIISPINSYKKLESDMCQETMQNIRNFTINFSGSLRNDEISFLCNPSPRCSTFYILPKIHKSPTITNVCLNSKCSYVDINYCPIDLQSRPIINNVNSPTSNLSYFIDKLLEPFISLVDSYIYDSFDFLSKLPKYVYSNTTLVNLDVKSLYTCIPHDFGMIAIQFWLQTYPSKLDSRFSVSFILESLSIILKQNSFRYKSNYFLQLSGVAMGTTVAPKYAQLVMGYFEILVRQSCARIYGDEKTRAFLNIITASLTIST